jgi:HD-GYP domain-containing protein (c-di-GMP phosphodiesterase class II)
MSNVIVKEKINVANLEVGMYICELDRPWLESPFPLQGFYIRSKEEIEELNNYCGFVYIDIKKTLENSNSPINQYKPAQFSDKDKLLIHSTKYQDSRPMEAELPDASSSFEDFSINTEVLVKQLKQGQVLDIKKFRKSTKQMVESVIRNPDAMLWLSRLKQNDDYLYQHSVRCSVLAVAFGRQLGLSSNKLNNLALGAALMDIGKLKLPKTLLNRPGRLCEDEFDMIRDHVRLSLNMIADTSHLSKDVYDLIAHHHERVNGKGYPNKLKGNDIPLFGRIAAIVDCYDAISSNRSYAKAISPAEAVRKLYEWRDIDFHAALVEVFIQALGIYPAGSMVELSTGEVGVVMSEYRARRLRPKVMVILDKDKRLLAEFPTIDLYLVSQNEAGEEINIKQSLEPGSYGVNPSELLLG